MQLDLFTELAVAKCPPRRKVAKPKPAKLEPQIEAPDLFQDAQQAEVAQLIAGFDPVSKADDAVTVAVAEMPVPRPETIERCIDILTARGVITGIAHIVETTSGGVFFIPQMQTIAGDAVSGSRCRAIKDFLEWLPPNGTGSVVVIGCPANGKNGETALQHLNHAARFADRIAFILSDAFAKPSRLRRIDPLLHLVIDEALPAKAFERRAGRPALSARLMVFERRKEPRVDLPPVNDHPDFRFVPSLAMADFAIRRVGGHAGKVINVAGRSAGDPGLSPSSNHFIAVETGDPFNVRDAFERAYRSGGVQRRGGHRSIPKAVIVQRYIEACRER
jgi:hypothetical protein